MDSNKDTLTKRELLQDAITDLSLVVDKLQSEKNNNKFYHNKGEISDKLEAIEEVITKLVYIFDVHFSG